MNPANNQPEDPTDFPKPPMIDKTATVLQSCQVLPTSCEMALECYGSKRPKDNYLEGEALSSKIAGLKGKGESKTVA